MIIYNRRVRVLAVDWGERRVGLALSDETGVIAFPHGTVNNDAEIYTRVLETAAAANVDEIVVGLPLTLAGEEGVAAAAARAFAEELRRRTTKPVTLWDERLTTEEAAAKLIAAQGRKKFRGKGTDAAAAAVLLQNYLDAKNRNPQ